MKVLVTGGTGFLGRQVVKQAREAGHEVWPFGSNQCDLTREELKSGCPVDVVIHLAANVGGIGKNQRLPATLADDNLRMGMNAISFCVKNKCKLVLASTICSYPKYAKVPFQESDLWSGYPEETNAPYGLAKKMLMVLAEAHHREHGLKQITLLPVNLYGPYDNFDLEDSHVIPAMIRKMHEAKESSNPTVTLWGDGSPTREFLYVEDCAGAFVSAMDKECDGPVNIGSGMETTMRDLASMIKGVVGYDGDVIWDASKPNGQPRRCLNVTKAAMVLGWKATTPFLEGLRRTYDHYESIAE